MVKSIHTDKHNDTMEIYRSKQDSIFIDCLFSGENDVSWRGLYSPAQARQIANRLTALADIIEGK